MATKIEWCDLTINPFVGCSKCSPGCDNCYAEKMAYRLSRMKAVAQKYAGVVNEYGWTGKVNVDFSCFDKLPKAPKRIFVNSMSDTFHGSVSHRPYSCSFSPLLFNNMSHYPQHTFLLLTKRPKRMKAWIDFILTEDWVDEVFPNVWLGVTVCNQQEADEKIPVLLKTPAAKRFVSIEPMLGPIDLRFHIYSEPTGEFRTHNGKRQLQLAKPVDGGLHWVICGGETGPKARSAQEIWFRNLRDQCQAAEVPFFLKKNVDGSRLLDGQEWNQFPQ